MLEHAFAAAEWIVAVAGALTALAGFVWGTFKLAKPAIARRTKPLSTAWQALQQLPEMQSQMTVLIKSVGLIASTQIANNDNDPSKGMFECDETGANISANRTYARWLGVGKADLLGWTWINYVHRDDVQRVRAEWDLAMHEHRPYQSQYRMVAADGEVFHVDVSATPIPESPPAQRWIGVVRKASDQVK